MRSTLTGAPSCSTKSMNVMIDHDKRAAARKALDQFRGFFAFLMRYACGWFVEQQQLASSDATTIPNCSGPVCGSVSQVRGQHPPFLTERDKPQNLFDALTLAVCD